MLVDFGFIGAVGAKGVVAIALQPRVSRICLLRQADLLPCTPAVKTNKARPVVLGRRPLSLFKQLPGLHDQFGSLFFLDRLLLCLLLRLLLFLGRLLRRLLLFLGCLLFRLLDRISPFCIVRSPLEASIAQEKQLAPARVGSIILGHALGRLTGTEEGQELQHPIVRASALFDKQAQLRDGSDHLRLLLLVEVVPAVAPRKHLGRIQRIYGRRVEARNDDAAVAPLVEEGR